MYRIAILVTLLTGCVTMDKLRTEDCRDTMFKSSVVDNTATLFPLRPGALMLCSTKTSCCMIFVEERLADERDLMDGVCYLDDSKYRYKTFCEEK